MDIACLTEVQLSLCHHNVCDCETKAWPVRVFGTVEDNGDQVHVLEVSGLPYEMVVDDLSETEEGELREALVFAAKRLRERRARLPSQLKRIAEQLEHILAANEVHGVDAAFERIGSLETTLKLAVERLTDLSKEAA